MQINNWEFICKANDSECMSVEQRLKVVNRSKEPREFSLPIAIGSISDAKSITITYKDITKKIKISQLSKSDLILFDDEIACGNLVISINQDEMSMSIEISNFPPRSSIDVIVEMSAYLLDDIFNLYFVIAPIDKYDKNLYPNYKISIQILTNKIKIKDIKFEYNGKDHTKEIYDKRNISADDISFQSSLILKMPLKNIEHRCFNSLLKVSDIIFFIDSNISSNPVLSSSVINFLNNYGINYRFNIIQYGSNSCALYSKMVEKNQETIDEARNFFRVKNSQCLKCDFIDAYTNILGIGYNGSILKSEQDRMKYQALHIDDINMDNTIAICFGSLNENRIITTRKIPTFIIDPILKYNTVNFALRNGFEFVGPFIHTKNEVEYAFNHLIQKIRNYSNEPRNHYLVEESIDTTNVVVDDDQTKQNQNEIESRINVLIAKLELYENEVINSSPKDHQENLCECNVEAQICDQIKPTEEEDPNNNYSINYSNNYSNNNNNDTNNSLCSDEISDYYVAQSKMVSNQLTNNQCSYLSFQIDDINASNRTYETPLNISSIFNDECILSCISYQYDDYKKVSFEEMKKIENEKIQEISHDQDINQIKFSNSHEKVTEFEKNDKENETKNNNNKSKNNNNENKNNNNETKNNNNESKNNNNKTKNNNNETKLNGIINDIRDNGSNKIIHHPQIIKLNDLSVHSRCFSDHDNEYLLIQAKFPDSDMPDIDREYAGNDYTIRI